MEITSGNDFLGKFLQNVTICDDKQDNEYEKRRQLEEYHKWQENCGLDKAYYDATIGGLMTQETINTIQRYIDLFNSKQAPIMLIMGQVGTGKTYAVASILNACGAGTFVDMTELKLKIDSAQRYGSQESYEALMHRLAGARLLALDEVGRFRSNQEQEILFYLVNKRYANNRPMIISTNMDGMETAKYLGTAISDRIKSKLLTIKLDGKSKRINTLMEEKQ